MDHSAVVEKLPPRPKGWGSRHTLALLGFFGFALSYAMRFNLSLAIVAMVKSAPKALPNITQEFRDGMCDQLGAAAQDNSTGLLPPAGETGEFDWDEAQQGIILGSFFWGYIITQLPGGIISSKFGGKWPLGIGLLVTAVFAILTPLAARTNVYLLMVCRVIQGLGEGLTTPAMHAILANWVPPAERSKLGSVVYAGTQLGTAATMVIGGYLIAGNVLGGWPSVFYTVGAATLVWFVFWCIFMYDSPRQDPRISPEELEYIEKSIGCVPKEDKDTSIPWRAILTSVPVWALVVAHVGHAWGLYTLLTMLPTYLKTVLHFDIKQNSWISAAPYVLMWAISIVSCQFADWMIERGILKTLAVRKICQTISQLGPALLLIGASYSGCDRFLTVALLTIGVGINGIVYGGYVVNHVDISPNYAGVLMGITNTFANLTGFAAPALAGYLTKNNSSLFRWQLVFFTAAGVYFVDVVTFLFFGSSDVQSWNFFKSQKPKDSEKADCGEVLENSSAVQGGRS